MIVNHLLSPLVQLPLLPLDIKKLSFHSQQTGPDCLFIAIPGQDSDGRDYIADALAKGTLAVIYESIGADIKSLNKLAKANPKALILPIEYLAKKVSILASHFYQNPSQNMKVIGVTGTNGKTTITHLLAQAYDYFGQPCGVIGTLGYGLLQNWHDFGLTTPDAILLQKILAEFRDNQIMTVAMEASSHGLDQGRVNQVNFQSAIFTNLTQDHLDYHGTIEAYGRAKRLLFETPTLKQVVLNIDDPYALEIVKVLNPSIKVVSYSVSQNKIFRSIHPNTVYVMTESVEYHPAGLLAQVQTSWGNGVLKSKLIGEFNLSNLLALLAELCLSGIPLDEALQVISRLNPVKGRMQRFGGTRTPQVIVDYAHTPDSLEQALKAARLHCKRKLCVVFGCGGNRDNSKRAIMGAIAAQYADKIILTNDNPRNENPEHILAEIYAGIPEADQKKVTIEPCRKTAIKIAVERSLPVDVILVAGKGHEEYQLIGKDKIAFSDEKTVQKILQEVGGHVVS
jgi:UDP-N-acetylmuramoyl-L-alanyl-D-glutamate--2,6-diaminopimelate ligase